MRSLSAQAALAAALTIVAGCSKIIRHYDIQLAPDTDWKVIEHASPSKSLSTDLFFTHPVASKYRLVHADYVLVAETSPGGTALAVGVTGKKRGASVSPGWSGRCMNVWARDKRGIMFNIGRVTPPYTKVYLQSPSCGFNNEILLAEAEQPFVVRVLEGATERNGLEM